MRTCISALMPGMCEVSSRAVFKNRTCLHSTGRKQRVVGVKACEIFLRNATFRPSCVNKCQ